MVREELKTKGCLFGHLSDINPSLIEELDKLKSIRNPENFTRVTHSYTKIVPSEATTTNNYDEAEKVKNIHLNGNTDGKLWQTFFTWSTEHNKTIKLRKFDPANEEDTNLLITKEILQYMSNRINYNCSGMYFTMLS